ncbi:MAG: N-acetyl-gamma-glutamyl-phosphate reductase [Odoribacteraceae bacterium]|jgi:N-acetyl-gamma-glutamyl-phosphate reductase|nr:N-acetyl-gamma-glutamyl-phosphate reductase [Odoribacteraceae bacterium]
MGHHDDGTRAKRYVAGIVGAAGYTAGELIRILLHHPDVDPRYMQSESHGGEAIGTVHQDLVYENRCFREIPLEAIDLLFICSGHGGATRFLRENRLPERTRVIDLGSDFRLRRDAGTFVYGLPELSREALREARHVANPGCFATAIELALLPLAAARVTTGPFHVFGVTGSTGAGQQPTGETHFSFRAQNLSNYKVFRHQHLAEIKETLSRAGAAAPPEILFVPTRGAHARGIIVNVLFEVIDSPRGIEELYRAFYRDHPFTVVCDAPLHLKQVVNTNYCFIHIEQEGRHVLVSAVLDNLLKGASGQAVQNMNLMLGLDETAGLALKANYF